MGTVITAYQKQIKGAEYMFPSPKEKPDPVDYTGKLSEEQQKCMALIFQMLKHTLFP